MTIFSINTEILNGTDTVIPAEVIYSRLYLRYARRPYSTLLYTQTGPLSSGWPQTPPSEIGETKQGLESKIRQSGGHFSTQIFLHEVIRISYLAFVQTSLHAFCLP